MTRTERIILSVFLLAVLAPAEVFPQSGKKRLTERDYGKWSQLIDENISPDAKWYNYRLQYKPIGDSLFLKSIANDKSYVFPQGKRGRFSSNAKWFSVDVPGNGTGILNLSNGIIRWIKGVKSSEFMNGGNYVITQLSDNKLNIINLVSGEERATEPISEYRISADGEKIACVTMANTVQVLNLDNPSRDFTVIKGSFTFKNLTWNRDGNTLAFLKLIPTTADSYSLYCYKMQEGTGIVQKMELPANTGIFANDHIVSPIAFTPIVISPDGERIFFQWMAKAQRQVNEIVEVWNSQSKLEYPQFTDSRDPLLMPKTGVWWPSTGKVAKISSNDFPDVQLSPDGKFAVISNSMQYEPQYEQVAPIDIYITEVETGITKLVVQKLTGSSKVFGMSPLCTHINYFKDGNWYVYNLRSGLHANLTGHLNKDFSDMRSTVGTIEPYGRAVWSSDENNLLVYDESDIWVLSLDGKNCKRITPGAEKKMQFRLVDLWNKPANASSDIPIASVDLSQDVIIEGRNEAMGCSYYNYSAKGKLVVLASAEQNFSRLKKAKAEDTYIFLKRSFSDPPKLMLLKTDAKPQMLFQSNPQHYNYEWGTAELMTYADSMGVQLHGILYYPAGFNASLKYPMVVNIYEKQSIYLHDYYNPTEYDIDGFCPSNYTSSGYFVFYPDIKYTSGNTGQSSVDCVAAGLKAVVAKGNVDPARIGLNGHSFGGYQTNFIIGNSKVFAAAVSGAGVADLISNYLLMEPGGRSNMWRIENQQYRMAVSLFEDFDAYIRNSPITYVPAIITPLLLWTGKNDRNVDPSQSTRMHLAMRRLQKRNIYLVYPGGDHVLFDPKAQKDLTGRIKKWFDHYLRNIPLPADME